MKRFFIQLSVLGFISLAIFGLILTSANGYTDAYYIRFTTPKQQNLILGSSRAAQGLQPSVFSESLGVDMFNYAFTINQSPYGPVYLESVKRKIKESDNGVFVLTIDPWSISSISDDPNDLADFRENDLCVGITEVVDAKPNYEYLYKNLSGRYADIIINYVVFNYSKYFLGFDYSLFVHDDGWLEVHVDMDSAALTKRRDSKVRSYRKNRLNTFKYSSARVAYLKETIEYLSNYGEVYIVRLPIHDAIEEVEHELMPDFDQIMKDLEPMTNGYLDLTPKNMEYVYTDGNHLSIESSEEVSREIAQWILKRTSNTSLSN